MESIVKEVRIDQRGQEISESAVRAFLASMAEEVVCQAQSYYDDNVDDEGLFLFLLKLAARMRVTKTHYWSDKTFEQALKMPLKHFMDNHILNCYQEMGAEHALYSNLPRLRILFKFTELFIFRMMSYQYGPRIGDFEVRNGDPIPKVVTVSGYISELGIIQHNFMTAVDKTVEEWEDGDGDDGDD